VLFSTDLNAACPNSVIEAMACGLPVLAYDTGALAEIVQDGAGEVVPYGADHWQLEDPQVPPLAEACLKILQDNPPTASTPGARRSCLWPGPDGDRLFSSAGGEMTTFNGRVGLVQRVLPSYRAPFFNALAAACASGLAVFAGKPRRGEMIKTVESLDQAQLFHAKNLHCITSQLVYMHPNRLAALAEGLESGHADR
jgi:hypothetical protein